MKRDEIAVPTVGWINLANVVNDQHHCPKATCSDSTHDVSKVSMSIQRERFSAASDRTQGK